MTCDWIPHGNRKQTSIFDFAGQQPFIVQTSMDIKVLRSDATATATTRNTTLVPLHTFPGGGMIDETAHLLFE